MSIPVASVTTAMSATARRVVVTGMGAVSPLGLTFEASWKALLEHKCGVTTLDEALQWQGLSPDALAREKELLVDLPCQVAAAVKWDSHHAHNNNKRTSRNVQFALEAARQAVHQAKLINYDKGHDRFGVSMGCGMSSLRDITQAYQTLRDEGYRKISPHFVPKSLTNSAAGRLSLEFGYRGPNCTASTACAASSHAIGDAYRLIQFHHANVMLAGGSEASLEPVGLAGFGRLRALSTGFHDDPSQSSRPFDAQRDGFVMGEGAAVLVLEELEHAQRRGAPILAEIIGYGLAGDGHHITAPDPNGSGAERAMRMALQYNDDLAARVDYVNAHATSTPVGDKIEAQVIDRVLSNSSNVARTDPLYVSSTKGATGHLLGAAGALETAFTIQTLVDQVIPPTLNLETIDEETQFQHVPDTITNATIDVAMKNSFGFGGTNVSLVFQRFFQ